MAINYSPPSDPTAINNYANGDEELGLVSKGSEGGVYKNETVGEYASSLTNASLAINARIAAEEARDAAEAALEEFEASPAFTITNTDISNWNVAHTFATTATTSSLLDVDNSARTDGSILIFNSTSDRYTATNTINNNMTINGGSF
jgi:hypothetical protein